MKAIRVHQFGGPQVLRLEEQADPVAGPGQVVVRLKAVGVNPVDTYVRSGKYPALPQLPYTPGSDGAGLIDSVGPNVGSARVGQRVFIGGTASGNGFGAYATHALCSESQVHPLPDNISFQQGAAVNIAYGTAYRALFHRARIRPGETVLVHGATGGVGTAAVQWAVAAGAVVIGTGSTQKGRDLVSSLGASHVLNHRTPGYLDEIGKITNGKGVDVVIEMLANVNLNNDLGVLAKFGRVVVVGNRGTIEIDPRQTMSRESSILGMNLWAAGEGAVAEAQAAIVAGLKNQTLKPTVDVEYPLADAAKAHEDVMQEGSHGKVVLIP
jgi:NADPH2:quinone reductase